MKLITRNFGEIEYDETDIIYFKEGLPGFEHLTKFILLCYEEDKPLSFIQSVEDGNISLTLLSPMEILDGYSFEIDDDLIKQLGEVKGRSLAVYSVVVIPEKIEDMTTNLKAPIIINLDNRCGMQYIINNDKYDVRYSIYNDLVTFIQKGGENLC